MTMLATKNIANNTIYGLQEPHSFFNTFTTPFK